MSSRIGSLIRARRKAHGLTCHELGQKVGRDRQMVGRWERGVCMPSPAAFAALVDEGIVTRDEIADAIMDSVTQPGGEAA